MGKRFWAVIAVLVLVFVGVIVYSSNKDSASKVVGSATNHVEGTTSSGVTLVEYGDYQCPACGSFYQTVKDSVAKYQGQVQFQFRNLPLTSLHPNAFAGARAAEAAGNQGKYFEMHDLLYQNQNSWSASTSPLTVFTSFARSIGLNETKFKADFASSKTNADINADVAAFEKTGADKATPTFFINGKLIKSAQLVDSSGQPSVDSFSKVIEAAIAAKK